MNLTKEKILKFLDLGILVSLGIHVISSQWYIAISSIGQGTMIGLIIIRLIINRDVYKAENFIYIVFLLFVLAEMLSSVFSENPANSFLNSKRVLLFTGFFAAFTFIKDLKQLRYFLLVFFIFTALLSTYEIIRYYFEYYLPNKDMPLSELRLQYFGYPITNAEIKMLILLLIIPFFFIKENFVLKKHWLALIAVPILITLILTSSRNAMLGIFAGIIVVSFLKNKKILLIFVGLVALFILFAPGSVKDRIMSIGDFNHPSNKSRFIMWDTGVKIIKDNFLLGIGDTDLLPVYKKYKVPEYHGEGVHMHNNFMQIFVSLGLIGILSWLLLMVYLFFRQVKIYLNTKNDKLINVIAVSSIVCMIAFQVSGLTEDNFGDFEFSAVLWFTLGLSYLAEKLYLQNAKA